FTKIDGVDTDLAEKLVEQGILSYDDLSVMEIADLVNTIEGLTEEQAMDIVGRAEVLAEEQAEEMPRRKGGGKGGSAAPAEGGEGQAARPTLDDLFGGEATTEELSTAEEEEPGSEGQPEVAAADEELRDVALAFEEAGSSELGHEVTSPPSDADQDETARIV